MEKKHIFAIPIFFLLFSILFPIRSGADLRLVEIESDPSASSSDILSFVSFPYFPGKICTAYKSSGPVDVVGFADGDLLLKNGSSGYEKLEFKNDARVKAVYSVAVSDDAKYVAATVGADPRSLFIFADKDGIWRLFRQDKIEADERRGAYLEFVGDTLFYEADGVLFSYGMRDAAVSAMEIGDKIKSVAEDPSGGCFWVLSEENLYLFRRSGVPIAVLRDTMGMDFLTQSDDSVVIFTDKGSYSVRLGDGR